MSQIEVRKLKVRDKFKITDFSSTEKKMRFEGKIFYTSQTWPDVLAIYQEGKHANTVLMERCSTVELIKE